MWHTYLYDSSKYFTILVQQQQMVQHSLISVRDNELITNSNQ